MGSAPSPSLPNPLRSDCDSCGRAIADPRTHWHDLCYPRAARLVFGAFALAEVAVVVLGVRSLGVF